MLEKLVFLYIVISLCIGSLLVLLMLIVCSKVM